MSSATEVQIFMEPNLRQSAETGQHNFINKIVETLQESNFRVEFCDTGTPVNAQFSLIHMKSPVSKKGLLFRRVYHYPFWQIEQVAARWEWDVAKAAFDPAGVAHKDADRFAGFWRKRLFDTLETHNGKYVYIPLQGRLLERRSFQQCSPIDMIKATLANCGERRVIAGLHPKETYSTAENAALELLELHNNRLSIARGDMRALLAGCDYVVAQNSGVAFSGFLLGKAALLFARIDFHHIAIQADMADLAQGFEAVAAHKPEYTKYIWWFWQDQTINAGRPEAGEKVAARLRRFGWPIR